MTLTKFKYRTIISDKKKVSTCPSLSLLVTHIDREGQEIIDK